MIDQDTGYSYFPFFPLSLIVMRDIRFYRSQESFLLCVHVLEIVKNFILIDLMYVYISKFI